MAKQMDLVGKTISGVVATPVGEEGPLKIWMLQFSDGTHVEFVSPGARKALSRLSKPRRRRMSKQESVGQLALNVA